MKLIRGIHNLSQAPQEGCVLTIGNFDGVHRGHRALLQGLQEEGRKRNLPVMVMLFEPQPLELFATDKAPARLTRLREKLRYLAECGVDYVLCVRFDRRFAALTAQNFISDLLVKHLRVKFLAVGDDFRFGAGREGDFLLLQKAGMEYGFDITSTQTFCEGGVRISSTAVRQALADDNLALAESLLGHPFAISGRVVHGDELGRTIGSRRRMYRYAVRFPGERGLCGRSVGPWRKAVTRRCKHRNTPNGCRYSPATGSAFVRCCNGPLWSPYTSSAA